MTRIRGSIALLLALSAVTLVGCSDPGTATPTPAPIGTTPTAVPTVDPAIADVVTLSSQSLVITNTAGQTASAFTYFDAVGEVVDALTGAFGIDPAVTNFPSPSDGLPFTTFEWDGLTVYDESATAELMGPSQFTFVVTLSASEIGGVDIQTVDGVSVGDATVDVAALYPGSSPVDSGLGDGPEVYRFETGRVNVMDGDGSAVLDGDGSPLTIFLTITGMPGGSITSIIVPDGGAGRA